MESFNHDPRVNEARAIVTPLFEHSKVAALESSMMIDTDEMMANKVVPDEYVRTVFGNMAKQIFNEARAQYLVASHVPNMADLSILLGLRLDLYRAETVLDMMVMAYMAGQKDGKEGKWV